MGQQLGLDQGAGPWEPGSAVLADYSLHGFLWVLFLFGTFVSLFGKQGASEGWLRFLIPSITI